MGPGPVLRGFVTENRFAAKNDAVAYSFKLLLESSDHEEPQPQSLVTWSEESQC